MQAGDNVQVLNKSFKDESNFGGAIAIEAGVYGNAMKLWGVHYFVSGIDPAAWRTICMGLSSHPQRFRHTFVAKYHEMLASEHLYGKWMWTCNIATSGATVLDSKVIPLYGIIRPRRQMWEYHLDIGTIEITIAMELYYEPVILNKTDLDALDRKYGKYKRT